MALIMALGMLTVLSVSVTTAVYYSSSSARSSNHTKAGVNAYALAEAGINDALSQLNESFQPATPTAIPQCSGNPGNPPRTVTVSTGSYTYCGDLVGTVWTITSTGSIKNPTGPSASNVTRTLKRTVTITGIANGSDNSAWSRIYNNDNTACFTIPADVNIPSNVGTRGNLCLNSGSSITGSSTEVAVGGTVTLSAPDASVTAVDPAGAGAGWTNSGNIVASDNVKATATVAANADSANLDATGFGFALPPNATVLGVTVKVERAASAASTLKTSYISLLKGGAPTGTSKSSATFWGTGDANGTFGASNDLWGATLTAADVDASNFGVRIVSHNYTGVSATASIDYVEITLTYSLDTSIGANGAPVSKADISSTCKWNTQAAHTPCTSTDHVWSGTITSNPTGLSKPTVDFAYWYDNAAPGPKHGCDVSSGTPPAFDNNTAYDGSAPDAWIAQDPTPKDDPAASNGGTIGNTSYTCIAKDAQNNVIGELSWNNQTRVLTVKGTIFFDGQVLFHYHNGYVVHYQGKATIYASGGWHNDEAVCAGGSGLTTCRNKATISNWDPTQNMLVFILGDKNAAGSDDCHFHTDYSAFQGVLWAKNNCEIKDTAYSSGPVLAEKVLLTGTPSFFTWPPLGTLLDGQIYGSSQTSSDFLVQVGSQSG